jgi:flagellar hook assembly protein FlgD
VSQDTTYLDEPLTPEVTYYYKVTAVDTFGVEGFPSEVIAVVPGMTGVAGGEDDQVLTASFSPARPNPFSNTTEVAFAVPAPGVDVDLRIYDVSGRLVRTLAEGRHAPGVYRLVWDGLDGSGRRVASGVYFSRVVIGEWRATRKMVLLR